MKPKKLKSSICCKVKMIAINPKWRITSGGTYEDFEDYEKAIAYMNHKLQTFSYASINKVYTFIRNDDGN